MQSVNSENPRQASLLQQQSDAVTSTLPATFCYSQKVSKPFKHCKAVFADHLIGNIKHASVNLLIDFACGVDKGIFDIVSSLG